MGSARPWEPPLSVHQPKDRVADAPDVARHQSLGAPRVRALERVDDREVLADERLDATGRHNGHGPDGSDLLAHLLQDLGELRVFGSLEQVPVELPPSGRTSAAVAFGPRARSSRKRVSNPSRSSRPRRGPASRTASPSSASRTSYRSRISSCERVRTKAPFFGTTRTRWSRSSLASASRTGVRLTRKR